MGVLRVPLTAERQPLGRRVARVAVALLAHALLLAGAALMLAPLVWMLSTAVKPPELVFTYPPVWLPWPPRLENFPDVLASRPFGLYFRNTLLVALFAVLGDLFSASVVGYAFARLRFPGRDALFVVLLATIMMPFIVRLIPLFVLFQKLGWTQTLLPLIVPSFTGTPFFIFMVRQFFLGMPSELSDAARIDGASEWGILWRVFLPNAQPVLAVVVILSFQHVWNDFLGPLVFLSRKDLHTLALGLRTLLDVGASAPQFHLLMAATLLMLAPVLALFAAFQRYFVEGVVTSGLKG